VGEEASQARLTASGKSVWTGGGSKLPLATFPDACGCAGLFPQAENGIASPAAQSTTAAV
jgi:hypothetical protein